MLASLLRNKTALLLNFEIKKSQRPPPRRLKVVDTKGKRLVRLALSVRVENLSDQVDELMERRRRRRRRRSQHPPLSS